MQKIVTQKILIWKCWKSWGVRLVSLQLYSSRKISSKSPFLVNFSKSLIFNHLTKILTIQDLFNNKTCIQYFIYRTHVFPKLLTMHTNFTVSYLDMYSHFSMLSPYPHVKVLDMDRILEAMPQGISTRMNFRIWSEVSFPWLS